MYLKFAKTVGLRVTVTHTHRKKKKNEGKKEINMWEDEYINERGGGNHFTMYMYIKASSWIP